MSVDMRMFVTHAHSSTGLLYDVFLFMICPSPISKGVFDQKVSSGVHLTSEGIQRSVNEIMGVQQNRSHFLESSFLLK